MEITHQQDEDWDKSQIGKFCEKHQRVIKQGHWGNYCGRDKLDRTCAGNPYPRPEGETLTVRG